MKSTDSNPTKSLWMATVFVDGKPVDFKLDSGAHVTLFPSDAFLNLDLETKPYNLPIKCNWDLATIR